MASDTIAAISTPPGEGGISIVRLSGPEAIRIAHSVFRPARPDKSPTRVRSHTIIYGHIVDPQSNRIIDEVLLSVMRAPYTYTREDIVEINCHGGAVVTAKVLDLLLRQGARLAEPGEFTKRAFLNGRIDLSQAEAVIDLIRAKTDLSLKAAANMLLGGLSEKIRKLRNSIAQILAEIEASIDFPDEDLDFMPPDEIMERLNAAAEEMKRLLETAKEGRILREGVRAVIAGKPNVGKSSLLNRLLSEERAIVTDIPGTTRDSIEEYINIGGIPVRIIDTAGIRLTTDPVELEGVKRSKRMIEMADLVLAMFDSSQELTEEDFELLKLISDKPALIVMNKIDLPSRISSEDLAKHSNRRIVRISALKEIGMDELKAEIVKLITGGRVIPSDPSVAINLRHRDALRRALESLSYAMDSIGRGEPPELIAVDLRGALNCLGEIVGAVTSEEILDRIFSQFCIGK